MQRAIQKGINVLVLSLVWGVVTASAQSDRGTITGIVTDTSGAVIEGASVTATNLGTGASIKTPTAQGGSYTIPQLRAGQYELRVEKTGFKTYLQSHIAIDLGQTVTVDLRLEVGSVTQTVEVKSGATQLMKDTSDLDTVISSTAVEDLPLLGQGQRRSPAAFMELVPGTTGRGSAPSPLSTTVNGSQSGANEFALEGAPLPVATEFSGDPRVLGFPEDAISEFELIGLNAPAESGRSAGGTTSFMLKSGTNRLHGSVYEYLRNDKLDARGFFVPSVSPLKQNEFGATVGGPIRKDKTFFFGWYSGFRFIQTGGNSLSSVPTDAMKNGDFSQYMDANGNVIPIYDPTTTVPDGSGGFTRQPYAGNIILPTQIDPVSQAILGYFPEPTPGRTGENNNFLSSTATRSTSNQWGVKIDHAFSANNRINGMFGLQNTTNPSAPAIPGPLGGGATGLTNTRNVRLSHDLILRPNLVNHVTVGWDYWAAGNQTSAPFDWDAKLGLAGIHNQGNEFPQFVVDGLPNGFNYGGGGALQIDNQHSSSVTESLTWVKGKHTFKFGFEYMRLASNDSSSNRSAGYFTFQRQETNLPDSPNSAQTGIGFASFLAGATDVAQVYVFNAANAERTGYYAGYAQDDFKVSRKLTINAGLRYELFRPTVDAFNRKGWVDPLLANPGAGGLLGALHLATPGDRAGVDAATRDFGPRIGLAYNLNEKTVVRASYGIFYGAAGAVRANRGQYIQGYNGTEQFTSPNNGITPAMYFRNGWPPQPLPFPLPNLSPSSNLGGSFYELDPQDGKQPYVQNYTLDIQRQLPGQIMLDVAYVGNKGTHLPSKLMPDDQMPTQYLDLGNLLFQTIGTPSVQVLPVVQAMPVDIVSGNHSPFPGFEALYGGGATLGQSLRRFPQYQALTRIAEGAGVSSYNSLQVKLDKRFSNGFTFLVAYTASKNLSDADSQFNAFSAYAIDTFNRRPERALATNDIPENLVLSYSYELPFGPGKQYAKARGTAGAIIGGWKIAGIQQYSAGWPQSVTAPNPLYPLESAQGAGAGLGRPNVVPGVPQRSAAYLSGNYDPNRDSTLNPLAFVQAPTFSFGDAPRTSGNLRSASYFDEDFSVIKTTHVTERVAVDFRVDFLNVFNRTVLASSQGGNLYAAAFNISDPNFGKVTSQSNFPREIQFGLKIKF